MSGHFFISSLLIIFFISCNSYSSDNFLNSGSKIKFLSNLTLTKDVKVMSAKLGEWKCEIKLKNKNKIIESGFEIEVKKSNEKYKSGYHDGCETIFYDVPGLMPDVDCSGEPFYWNEGKVSIKFDSCDFKEISCEAWSSEGRFPNLNPKMIEDMFGNNFTFIEGPSAGFSN